MPNCLRVLLVLLFGVTCLAAEPARPNILLMYADNLGWGDLGCYGNANVQTPHIDSLARDGVRCTDFYVVASTCTVSRGAILTGRYPERNGLMHQLRTSENWNGIGLPHRERILPQYLRDAGYATGCFGKWNIGFAPGSRPTERGFNEFLGFRSGNINYFTHTYHGEYDMFLGAERHHVEGYSGDVFAAAASDFIRRHADHPWFVYLPFNATHCLGEHNMAPGEKVEWQAPARAFARYGWTADDPIEKHRYLATVTALDDNVGQVLDTLASTGQGDRTLVMFISDMGALMRPMQGLGVASNGPYRDGAPSLYEGGIRVAAVFRWPGVLPTGSLCRELLSHLDVLPLCVAAAGATPSADRILDGANPLSALQGAAPSPHKHMVYSLRGASAVRVGDLKLVRGKTTAPWELYDLSADPGEARNLAEKQPDDVARLERIFGDWEADVKRDASEPVPLPKEQTID